MAFAQQAQLEIKYDLAPKVTDAPLNNSATMKITNNTYDASVCTEIGDVKDKKCLQGGGGGKLAGWPTDGTITQGPEGAPTHGNIFRANKFESVDIANAQGTEIHATFNGVVKTVHTCPGNCGKVGYGQFVILADTNGTFEIMHGHLLSIMVRPGETFRRGKVIGYMGTTGNSSGPHIHWEFRGIGMVVPNIPENITPRDCTISGPCKPATVSWDPNLSVDDGGSGVKTPPDKVLEVYNIKMNGFNPTAERWAREKLSEVSGTKFVDLVRGSVIAVNPPSEEWSSQVSCPADGGADIMLDQNQSKYPASEREDIFKVTLVHELAHIIQNCQDNRNSLFRVHQSISGDTHEKLYYGGLGGLTMYGRHANETGNDDQTGLDFDCPKGNVFKVNENYADMIAYYLSPNSRVKNVCNLPAREPNPYTIAKYAPYKALAEKIVGKYQPDL